MQDEQEIIYLIEDILTIYEKKLASVYAQTILDEMTFEKLNYKRVPRQLERFEEVFLDAYKLYKKNYEKSIDHLSIENILNKSSIKQKEDIFIQTLLFETTRELYKQNYDNQHFDHLNVNTVIQRVIKSKIKLFIEEIPLEIEENIRNMNKNESELKQEGLSIEGVFGVSETKKESTNDKEGLSIEGVFGNSEIRKELIKEKEKLLQEGLSIEGVFVR